MTRKMLMAALLMAAFAQGTQAQDLSGQRSEKQDVNMIPGKKLDHHGLIVSPTPHLLNVDAANRLDLQKGVKVIDKKGKFADDVKFLTANAKGIRLTIDFGEKLAAKAGVKPVSGAYSLKADAKGIQIVGYDERGAFYGLQTLRQIVNSEMAKGQMPYTTCNDYPDLPNRGVVEGFYGEPWSHQVRLSLIDYYGKNKMNTYLYGPKDDPYHSCPNWRLPYPEKEAKNISELVQACRRNRVDFVWAIHPGQDIKWNEEDYQNLVHKLDLMYDLGVRSFAIFFDDISGEGANPVKQSELLNRLAKEFVKAKGDVTPLVMCPTDYTRLWANPKPTGSLAIFGNTLDPSINVFWTGDVVCSDLTRETLDWVNSRIKRPAYYWWNFPVTDYARHIIMQGPTYGLQTDLTNKDLCGFVSNPMEHGEASKLALYGVADYAWNIANYNPLDNWERGLVDLTPEAHEAYRTFAMHSCDTETGYRRIESWETKSFRIDNFTDAQFNALQNEFVRVKNAPAQMEANCKNALLMKELRPWLTEFGKLGERGLKTMSLIKEYKAGNDQAFWEGYVNNRMSKEDVAAYEKHKSGTMVLQPFYEQSMDDMASGFFKKLTGKVPAFYKGIGTYATLKTTQSKAMFDNDSTTYYTSGNGQNTGDWIGADLGCVRQVSEVRILQGRNSVDDVDYFDNTVLEYSVDRKEWKALTGELKKQYIINWKTDSPVEARYIRIKKLKSDKRNWAAVRTFEVNPTTPERLNFPVEADNLEAAMYGFDENPCTSFTNKGTLTMGIEKDVKSYTLLLKLAPGKSLVCRQQNAKGKVLATTTIDSSFCKVELVKKAAKLQIEGSAEIFEIIPEK